MYLRALIEMAQHVGIATVAEWVEEPEAARLLGAWGVDYLEGNLFGAAAPPARENESPARTAVA
jgi:EAL domain-containing protein (putative c-di-GMP-specific phosphodiesterase class I)